MSYHCLPSSASKKPSCKERMSPGLPPCSSTISILIRVMRGSTSTEASSQDLEDGFVMASTKGGEGEMGEGEMRKFIDET